MPRLEALYYPAWDPPETWLRSALLFFEKVNVIVPTAGGMVHACVAMQRGRHGPSESRIKALGHVMEYGSLTI